MLEMLRSKQSKALSWLLVIIVFLISVYGIGYSFHSMAENSLRGNCIFAGKADLCAMDIFQHISLWQQIFTGLLPKFIRFFTVFAASTLLSVVILASRKNIQLEYLKDKKLPTSFQAYIIQQPFLFLSDPIKQALALGILQPQIFA